MKSQELPQPSAEEIKEIEKKRTLSDSELVRGGAEYVEENDGLRLKATSDQVERARKEMEDDLETRELNEDEKKYYEEKLESIRESRKIFYFFNTGQASKEACYFMGKQHSSLAAGCEARFKDIIGREERVRIGHMAAAKAEKQDIASIVGAKNFDELFDVLNGLRGIQGSKQYFDAKTIKETIGAVREEKLDLGCITNMWKLRDKVGELLKAEKEADKITHDEIKPLEVTVNRIYANKEALEAYHELVESKFGARKDMTELRNIGLLNRFLKEFPAVSSFDEYVKEKFLRINKPDEILNSRIQVLRELLYP